MNAIVITTIFPEFHIRQTPRAVRPLGRFEALGPIAHFPVAAAENGSASVTSTQNGETDPADVIKQVRRKFEGTRQDLAPLLRLVSWVFTPMAERHDVSLQIDAPEIGLVAECDDIRIQQVLENLLSNAIRFSPARSTITLGARHEGTQLRFWVDDQGPGVPVANQAELFIDSETSPRRARPGLLICRRIIEAHGGKIFLRNRPEGGAHFEFSLPALPPRQDSTATPDRSARAASISVFTGPQARASYGSFPNFAAVA